MLYRNASQAVSNSARNRCSLLTSNGHERTSAVGKLQSRCHRGVTGPGSRFHAKVVCSETATWLLHRGVPLQGGDFGLFLVTSNSK